MTRRVELRPAAERDLDRLAEFVAALSPAAGKRRARRLREALRSLGAAPHKGRPGPSDAVREYVIRIARSTYVARYQVTDDAVIIIRIWHGLEQRPR